MNVAYPAAEFETDTAAIEGLATLLRTGFDNPEGIRGTVKVSVPEHPGQDFVARFADELLIERHDLQRETDTQVTIPVATIRRIFREFEFLDWRDPEIIGTITFEGNLGYANHLAKCCLRPSDWTMARFRRAARLHAAKGYRNLARRRAAAPADAAAGPGGNGGKPSRCHHRAGADAAMPGLDGRLAGGAVRRSRSAGSFGNSEAEHGGVCPGAQGLHREPL